MVTAVIPDAARVLDEEDVVQEFGLLERKRLGDLWIAKGSSSILAVRSIVVPLERNFLLNPAHAEFGKIEIEPVSPFRLDERLFRVGTS